MQVRRDSKPVSLTDSTHSRIKHVHLSDCDSIRNYVGSIQEQRWYDIAIDKKQIFGQTPSEPKELPISSTAVIKFEQYSRPYHCYLRGNFLSATPSVDWFLRRLTSLSMVIR
jgi:hypothetical protein